MKVTELNEIINNTLMNQVKGIIMEQLEGNGNPTEETVRNFQTLSGLSDKISSVENIGNESDVAFIIKINDVNSILEFKLN